MIGGLSCQLSFSRSCSSPVALGSLGLGIPRVSTRYLLRFSRLLLLICFVVSISPNPAFAADPLSVEDILGTITSNAVNDQMANNAVIDDLAARWYDADAVKQDKMPVFNSVNGRDLRDYSKSQYYAATAAMGVKSWRMRSFDGSAVLYYGDPSFDIEYGKWYEYFTGQDLSGGSGGGSGGGSDHGVYVQDYSYAWHQTETLDGSFNFSYDGRDITGDPSGIVDLYNSSDAVTKFSLQIADFDVANVSFRYNRESLFSNDCAFVLTNVAGTKNLRLYAVTNVVPSTFTWVSGNSSSVRTIDSSNTNSYPDIVGYQYAKPVVTYGAANPATQMLFIISNQPDPNGSSGGGGGSDEPVYPPAPQPDTPSVPTPPDVSLPEPGDPPVDNPGTSSTVNNNTYNITNNTTTVDLQPILDALDVINSNIKVISRNFSDFSTYMQGWSARLYRMLYDWLKRIDDDLTSWSRSLYQMIDAWFGKVSGLLDEWNRLLWQELQNANQWLEGIFYKLGSGSSSEPDITYQPSGWWDWLGDILSGLLGDLPAAVSTLTGTMDGLHNLFPFSLPWDLAAMLALLVSDPVTPVFDLPVPYAVGGTAMVHVDLSPWDDVMSAVRSVMLLIFALGLLLRTRELLKGTEVPS